MPKVDIDGIQISYVVYGKGLPLALLHGFGGSKATWKRQIPEFRKFCRVIAMDHRGHGNSSKPIAGEYPISLIAEDTRRLLDRLDAGETTILLGHSMGCKIALSFYFAYPNRVGALILDSGITTGSPRHASKGNWGEDRVKDIMAKGVPQFFRELASLWFGPGASPDLLAEAAIAHRNLPLYAVVAAARGTSNFVASAPLKSIRVPTLIIAGECDLRTPLADLEMAHHAIPNSRLVILKGAGHMGHWEQPEAFNHAVGEFVREVSREKSLP